MGSWPAQDIRRRLAAETGPAWLHERALSQECSSSSSLPTHAAASTRPTAVLELREKAAHLPDGASAGVGSGERRTGGRGAGRIPSRPICASTHHPSFSTALPSFLCNTPPLFPAEVQSPAADSAFCCFASPAQKKTAPDRLLRRCWITSLACTFHPCPCVLALRIPSEDIPLHPAKPPGKKTKSIVSTPPRRPPQSSKRKSPDPTFYPLYVPFPFCSNLHTSLLFP